MDINIKMEDLKKMRDYLNSDMERCFEWVSADLFPNDGYAPILYCTTNDKLGVLKNTGVYLENWGFYKEKYHIKWWVYQSELL